MPRRVTVGRWYRLVGSTLVGWLALFAALMALGCPVRLSGVVAGLGVLAVGFPLLYRARTAAAVAVALVLAVGLGASALHRLAEADARRYLAQHPTHTVPATTPATILLVPSHLADRYPYCEQIGVPCTTAPPVTP